MKDRAKEKISNSTLKTADINDIGNKRHP